jgi:hypothetical protein
MIAKDSRKIYLIVNDIMAIKGDSNEEDLCRTAR